MAGQPLHEVMDKARAIIAAATPDYEPGLAFIEAPMNGPLESLPFAGGPRDGTRRFHVVDPLMVKIGSFLKFGQLTGSLAHHLHDAFVVRVRYHVPTVSGGYEAANAYVAADRQRLALDLLTAGAAWGDYSPSRLEVAATRIVPVQADGGKPSSDALVMDLVFAVQTFLP